MEADYKNLLEAVKNLQATTDHLNSVNDLAIKSLEGATEGMDQEEAKKILADITQNAFKIRSMAKAGDVDGILKVQSELMNKYSKNNSNVG